MVVVFLDVVTVVSLVTEVVREVLPPPLVSPSPVSPVPPEEISLLVLELSAPAAGTALPPPLDDDFLLDSAHENRHSFKHIIIFRPHKMAEENHDLCCVFFPNSAKSPRSPSLSYLTFSVTINQWVRISPPPDFFCQGGKYPGV